MCLFFKLRCRGKKLTLYWYLMVSPNKSCFVQCCVFVMDFMLQCSHSEVQELFAHISDHMPLSKKQAIAQLTQKASAWLNGSGDPEVHDALDASDFLSRHVNSAESKQAWKLKLLEFERRVAAMGAANPGSIGNLPDPLAKVPMPESEPVKVCLAAYQLGCEPKHRITGRAKNVRVLEVFVEMAERPFDTKSNPLQVELPSGAVVNGPMPDFDVGYFSGFTRALALHLLVKVLMEEASDEVLSLLLPEAHALLRVEAVVMPTMTPADRVNQTIAQKMSATERLRQDPCQLLRAFEVRAMAEGRVVDDALQGYMEDLA